MPNQAAIRELAELVEEHLSRSPRQDTTIGFIAMGIGDIVGAMTEAQRKSGNFSLINDKLRSGRKTLQAGVALAQREPPPESQGLLAFADRLLRFADLFDEELARLSAGETTLV